MMRAGIELSACIWADAWQGVPEDLATPLTIDHSAKVVPDGRLYDVPSCAAYGHHPSLPPSSQGDQFKPTRKAPQDLPIPRVALSAVFESQLAILQLPCTEQSWWQQQGMYISQLVST